MSNKEKSHKVETLLSDLDKLNQSLELVLAGQQELSDASNLLQLASQREVLINDILSQLDGDEKVAFATSEYVRHQAIAKRAEEALDNAKLEAINFVRNKKKANKYIR